MSLSTHAEGGPRKEQTLMLYPHGPAASSRAHGCSQCWVNISRVKIGDVRLMGEGGG